MTKDVLYGLILIQSVAARVFEVSYSAALYWVVLSICSLTANSRKSYVMHASIESLLCPEEELTLHRRLNDGDATASADLALNFLAPLIHWLVAKNSSKIPPDMCIEAAEDALGRRGHLRKRWIPRFIERVASKVVVGLYRTTLMAPAQTFYAHVDHSEIAAHIVLADSLLRAQGTPLLVEMARHVCSSVFGDSLEALAESAYAAAGAQHRFFSERSQRVH